MMDASPFNSRRPQADTAHRNTCASRKQPRSSNWQCYRSLSGVALAEVCRCRRSVTRVQLDGGTRG